MHSHQASPCSNLLTLPDELLTEIVGYAMTTNEQVTLAPSTMRKDVMRIKQQLLAPFALIPKLLAIAKKAFHADDLTYSFNIHDVSINSDISDPERPMPDFVNGDSEMCHIGPPACPELFLPSRSGGRMWLGTGATWIKHLEIVAPSSLQTTSAFQSGAPRAVFNDFRQREAPILFTHLPKTFPMLETLRVRVITYRISRYDSDFVDTTTGQAWWASKRPDLVSMALAQKVATFISTLDRYRPRGLKSKTLMLFQKSEVGWHAPVDEHLEAPLKDIERTAFDAAELDGLLWHMMDLPSCRLNFS